MSRDIQDFVSGFAAGASIGNSISGGGRYGNRNRTQRTGEPPNPELEAFDKKYGRGVGTATRPPSMAAPSRPNVVQAVPTSSAYGAPPSSGYAGVSDGLPAAEAPGYDLDETYRRGGAVRTYYGGGNVDGGDDEGNIDFAPTGSPSKGAPQDSSAEKIGEGAGGLAGEIGGSLWGPVGSMIGKKAGGTAGKAIGALTQGNWGKAGADVIQGAMPPKLFRRGGAVQTYAGGGDVLRARQQEYQMDNTTPSMAPRPGETGGYPEPPMASEAPLDPEETGGMPQPPMAREAPLQAPPQQAVPTLPAFGGVPGVGMGEVPPRNAQHQTQGEEREAGETPPATSAGGGKAGSTSTGKRKGLRDQTRVEAFDETADKEDPDNVLRNALHGGLKFAEYAFHLDPNSGQAVPVGGGGDPHTAGGQQAFMQGVGAATGTDVQALNGLVQQQNPGEDFTGPDGQAKLALKRMEIIYRHASNNGLTDKANKMAFEMLQYASGEAAKLGTRAVQAYKAGDIAGATRDTLAAYNQIPDGQHYAVGPDGKTVVVTNVNTGAVTEQVPYTPEMLFNAAMGLSNKSGYWNVIAQRAAGAVKGGAKAPSATKEEYDRSRIDLNRARIAKLQSGGKGGGGGAAPGADAVGAALESIGAQRVPRAGSSNSPAPAPPAGGGEQAAPPPDEAMISALGGGDGDEGDEVPGGGDAATARLQPGQLPRPADAPPLTPAKAPVALPPYAYQGGAGKPAAAAPAPSAAPAIDPTIRAAIDPNAPAPEFMGGPKAAPMTPEQVAAGGKPQVPQKDGTVSTEKSIGIEMDGKYYVIPTIVNGKSLSPEDAIAAFEQGANKPLGEFKSEDEATAFAEQRSRDLDKATGGAGDLKKGPSNPAETFDEPHPLAPYKGRNPYADILAGIDPKTGKVNPAMVQYWASKEGKSRKSGIIAEKQSLDKDVIEWNKAKKDFASKQSAETKSAAAAEKAELKGTYDKKFDAEKAADLEGKIATEIQQRTENKEDKRPSIFNDGTDTNVVHDLTMGLVTSNPNLGPKRGLAVIASLARAGTTPDEKNWRSYKVAKPDKLGNVVLDLDGDQYHLRKQTFNKLENLVKQRYAATMKKGTPEAGGSMTDRGLGALKEAAVDTTTNVPGKIEDWMRTGGPLGSAWRTSRAIGNAVGRGAQAVPTLLDKQREQEIPNPGYLETP